MDESEWDMDMEQWSLMSRCTKCGDQIYPHNARRAYEWAEVAYIKARSGGPSPETLRDARLPRKSYPNHRKNVRVLYY